MFKASWVLGALCVLGTYAMAQPASRPVGSEKNPIAIGYAEEKFTLDGDVTDWAKVQPIPAPFSKKEKASARFAWREEGFYGLFEVKDDKIEVNVDQPWTGDCIEFWIEKDFARAGDKTDNSAQYIFMPDPENKKNNKAQVQVPWGGDQDSPDNVKAVWKKTEDGYVIEFFIPKTVMNPAKLQDGTKLSLSYSIDNAGKAVEQFFNDKNTDEGYKNPSTWGSVILKK